ncbi:unnamed protein product [Prorocentrum cordatum]|uniref:Uncharacterized protein n=1 Tax=Prorocentrum cordatum TaxID=2364126 RepID=A0ABN9SQ04_9DINO|nr:unnamed protein product [Polarella glacialis]
MALTSPTTPTPSTSTSCAMGSYIRDTSGPGSARAEGNLPRELDHGHACGALVWRSRALRHERQHRHHRAAQCTSREGPRGPAGPPRPRCARPPPFRSSQRHRHLAHHLAAPQALRNPVSSGARVTRGALSCVEVCASGTRAEMQDHQALAPPDAGANAAEKPGAEVATDDAEEGGAKGRPRNTPLSLAWRRMSSSEDLADAHELPADIYEAITKSARIKTTLCEAIAHAEQFASAREYWRGALPEGLFDLFADFAEYG